MLKHSKSDIIRIRIAPRVKARIVKEAQKKGVTMSQLIRTKISE
tara:strand:- start:67 stop:198 length:132 start_codon:yes stop_codon:yes gene_type:complete